MGKTRDLFKKMRDTKGILHVKMGTIKDRNCMALTRTRPKQLSSNRSRQEAIVRSGLTGRTNWFQIGKGVRQGCILSSYLFNLYAEYIMRNTGLDEE